MYVGRISNDMPNTKYEDYVRLKVRGLLPSRNPKKSQRIWTNFIGIFLISCHTHTTFFTINSSLG